MALPPVSEVIGVAAGVLILGVGTFVLLAKPHAWLHRLFFVLALADGVSTILRRSFNLFPASAGGELALANYWYYYIVFLALLAGFGLLFPTPPARRILVVLTAGGIVLAAGTALLLYTLDRSLFWTATVTPDDRLAVEVQPLANVLNIAFVATTAFLVVKLTRDIRRQPSPSHRRQSALVLGGMVLAYGPYPAIVLVQALGTDAAAALFLGRLDRVAAYWASILFVAALLASAVVIARARGVERRQDARIVLYAYAGVVALSLVALTSVDEAFGGLLRGIGLVLYPLFLGFAIVRYEVFDIDRRLRRAATLTITAAALTTVFVVGENAVEGLLEETLLGTLPSGAAAGSVAAVATAALFVPVLKASRKVTGRVLPELTLDELHARKLEIYRHSLAGAYADGIVREGESRTLAALRESLGITPAEHDALVRQVQAG